MKPPALLRLFAVLALARPAAAANAGAQTFQISEGNSDHLFFKDANVAAHAVVTGRGSKPRLVIAFPAGDSGMGLWFKAPAGSSETFRAVGPLREPSRGEVELSLAASVPELTIEPPPVLDSIRAIRDRSQGGYEQRRKTVQSALDGLAEAPAAIKEALGKRGITADALRDMLSPRVRVLKDESLEFTRAALGSGKPYRLLLTPRKGTVLERTKDGVVIKSRGPGNPRFSIAASVGFDSLTPLGADRLLNADGRRCVDALDGPLRTSLRDLDFLAFKEKLLAGSWQYQTYFGRDTLLAAQMLAPVLAPEALEAALRSVLDRVSEAGEVAHEEALADQAALMRLDALNKARRDGEGWETALSRVDGVDRPIYDYKMIDGDFLLPLLAQEYVRDVPRARSAAFFRRRSDAAGSYADALDRTCRRIADLARPYAAARAGGERGEALARSLISLKSGEIVGDWRDSGDGLGGGRFPASVDVGLVAAGLRACAERTSGGGKELAEMARAWDHAQEHFMVHLSSGETRARLRRFLEDGGYSAGEQKIFENI